MRYLRYILVISVVVFGSCRGRTTISDDELARIFHDAFLSNAYVTTQSIKLDSLRLYEPIFNSYGYTTSDVQYTLGNFAMRKSARLGDVVERAISMLESEGVKLDKEVEIYNLVDGLVKQQVDRLVMSDSLIRVTALEDTTKLQLTLANPQRGVYRIKFNYTIEDDKNGAYRTDLRSERLFDDGDSVAVAATRTTQIKKAAGQKLESTLNVEDSIDRVVIELATSKRYKESPNIEITNFELWCEPSAEDARLELFNSIVDIDIFGDELLFAKDSL